MTDNVPTQQVEIPEYLKAYAQQGGDAQAMASSSVSVPRISLRGRQFRFMEGGAEVLKKNEFIDVHVLGIDPPGSLMVKTYYSKQYTGNSNEPPECASDDGVRPSAWVINKQNATCADCKWNQFGSATSRQGKPSKKCRDSKRMWLVRADADEKKPFSERTIYGLNVTVMSLKAFADYGRQLLGHGIQNQALPITRLTMVDAEFPQLSFSCVGFVKEQELPLLIERAEKKEWKMFTSAGLALAAPEDTGPIAQLPGAPGSVPSYVQAAQAAQSGAAPTQPTQGDTPPPSADAVINKW